MPQNPIAAYDYGATFGLGGGKSALDVTAATVIKASPGKLAKIIVVVAGSAGSLTVNDSVTTAGAATANQIFTVAFGSLTVGQIIPFDMPCANGITISAVTTGGQFSVSYI